MNPGLVGSEIHMCAIVEFWRRIGLPYCSSLVCALA